MNCGDDVGERLSGEPNGPFDGEAEDYSSGCVLCLTLLVAADSPIRYTDD